jgi:hypothetical protein
MLCCFAVLLQPVHAAAEQLSLCLAAWLDSMERNGNRLAQQVYSILQQWQSLAML